MILFLQITYTVLAVAALLAIFTVPGDDGLQ
jgi:hypothetical protein